MSKYGRAWEDIRHIRNAIKIRAPGVRTDFLANARKDTEELHRELTALLKEWRDLEDTES